MPPLSLLTCSHRLRPPRRRPSHSQAVPPITLPTVIVTAQKEPADTQQLPVSVTAVSSDVIESAGITMLGDAALFSPNTCFAELSARKISNIFIRGIGSSPANPGITTYIDGVPQLNTSSSSIEFLDIEQIEFVRGPQSALFGRNTLGGLVNVTSGRPSLTGWTGRVTVPFGSAGAARGASAASRGPSRRRLPSGCRRAGERDGFTTNDLTGHGLDSRSATSARPSCCGLRPPRGRPARLSAVSGRAMATTR